MEWGKRGFKTGWMGWEPDLRLQTGFFVGLRDTPMGLDGEVPAFESLGPPDLKGLPAVDVPFGLSFRLFYLNKGVLKGNSALRNLVALDYSYNDDLTDDGLKQLVGNESLTYLNLHNTKITDDGLKHISGIKSLARLKLEGTKITDAGLKHLSGLKNLTHLSLCFTRVSDAGLKELAGLKKLTYLNLSATKVTGDGLRELAGFVNLSG